MATTKLNLGDAVRVDFDFIKGDDSYMDIQFTNDAGQPVDIKNGYVATAKVYKGSTTKFVMDFVYIGTDTMRFHISKTQSNISPVQYGWNIILVDNNTGNTYTVVYGYTNCYTAPKL